MWPQRPPVSADASWSIPMEGVPTNQWASYYQSMPSTQVDWAVLAQQWIKLKSTETSQSYQTVPQQASASFETCPEGGGEANMEIEEDGGCGRDIERQPQSFHRPSFPDVYHSRQLPQVSMSPQQRSSQTNKTSGGNGWGTSRNSGLSRRAPVPIIRSEVHPGEASGKAKDCPLVHPFPSDLDAAARKKLPAWIREGLEKMERKKQKKEYEEIRQRLREEKLQKRRQEEILELQSKMDVSKSKFDDMNSDDDKTDSSDGKNPATPIDKKSSSLIRRSRFEPECETNYGDHIEKSRTIALQLSKEELLDEMSIVMKRTLTEVLLEVTTEDISAIVQDVLSKYSKSSVSSKRAILLSGSKSLVLGGISGYGSDRSESSGNGIEVEEGHDNDNHVDSESDLEIEIKKRLRHFERIEEDILIDCEAMEKRFDEREKIWMANEGLPSKSAETENIDEPLVKSRVRKSKSKKRSRSRERSIEGVNKKSSMAGHRRSRSPERTSRKKRRSASRDRRSRRSRSKEHYSRRRRSRSRSRSKSRPEKKRYHKKRGPSSSWSRSSSSDCSDDRRRRRQKSRS